MKNKQVVLGLLLILITLIASKRGGYIEAGAKTGGSSILMTLPSVVGHRPRQSANMSSRFWAKASMRTGKKSVIQETDSIDTPPEIERLLRSFDVRYGFTRCQTGL